MNKGLVDLAELRKKILKADFRGKSAYCFIDGDKIIKIYAQPYDADFMCLDYDKICDLSMFKADTIVFPNEYIYENGKKAGEILKYIKNSSINYSFTSRTAIKPLIDNYELVINDIMTYSNVLMHDLCSVNILYSKKNGFHIIDTSEWELHDNSVNNNIARFNSCLVNVLLEHIDLSISNYYHYPMIDRNLQDNLLKFGTLGKNFYHILECNLHQKYNFLNLMYVYMSLYLKYYNQEMKTLGDMKELTKILKKG